jgi:pyridoxamine 5'-phosphate oxidase
MPALPRRCPRGARCCAAPASGRADRRVQLATVAGDGTPRVRTLVFRGWGGPASLDLLSDGRSAKRAELAHQPAVELCWLLPRARSQFRLRGAVIQLEPEQLQREREQHWQRLTPGGRALWGWPAPGEPFAANAPFPRELGDHVPIPTPFLLLRIAVVHVELLELSDHPHRRRRWQAGDGWQERCLNP